MAADPDSNETTAHSHATQCVEILFSGMAEVRQAEPQSLASEALVVAALQR
jgi:hypothetical protein